ncbi:hypothetical protein CYMTET_24412, partial [Cymbomonas tetramitiformis]
MTVERKPRLAMFFRTSTGCVFQAQSTDAGRTWQPAAPINVPNPNTKFHILHLSSGLMAMAFNDHKRNQFCKACRTHLHIAVSKDEGVSWRLVARVEEEEGNGARIHYPTLLQHHNHLLVMYSRFYLDLGGRCRFGKLATCLALSSKNQ